MGGLKAPSAIIFYALILSLNFSTEIQAEDDPLKGVSKFGVSFATSVWELHRSGSRPSVVPSDANQVTVQLGHFVDEYKRNMRTTAASTNLLKANGELVIATAVIGGATTGVGAVPSAIVGTLAYWGNSAFAGYLREEGETKARSVLATSLKSWDANSAVSYEDIRNMIQEGQSEQAAKAFDEATGALSFIKSELKDDPAAADMAEKMLFKVAQGTTSEMLKQMGQTDAKLADLSQEFSKHVKASEQIADNTNKRLDELYDRLNTTQTDLKEGLDSLGRITKANQTQIGVIGDVLFGQQPAEVKIIMLQKGARPDLSANARADLIKVLQVQKKKDDLIRDTGKLVSDLQGIDSIMTSLGISHPEISKAISYASIAQSAMTQALNGNYIGAIAGALGVFGGSKPSAQEQYMRAIMAKLEEMDKKLNKIMELQQKTLLAIQELSNQIAAVERRLNERLDVIEFTSKNISRTLRSVLWQNYTSCQHAYDRRGNQEAYDQTNESFRTVRALYGFMEVNHANAIDCARSLDKLLSSMRNDTVFGQLLSLRNAAHTNFSPAPDESGRVYRKEELQNFIDGLYGPALEITLGSGWKKEWGHAANAVALLASPSSTTDGVRKRIDELERNNNLPGCSGSTLLSQRLRSLFCSTLVYAPEAAPDEVDADSEKLATERTYALMQDPIVRDQLPVLVQWGAFAARPYDLWTGSNDSLYHTQINELLEKGQPRGKELIWELLEVVDIGIAQQALLHGDMTALHVYENVWDTKEHRANLDADNSAVKLFTNNNNAWLQQNVVMFALEAGLSDELASGDVTVPYSRAIEAFSDNTLSEYDQTRIGSMYMRSLFGFEENIRFQLKSEPDGSHSLYALFPKGNDFIAVRLPSPKQLQARTLIYPESMYDLIRKREMLAERYIDYTLLSGTEMTSEGRLALHVLLHGTN
ncbi:hypothetical protein LZK77_16175 [Rhizobium leguminosarum]|nr:hypothetical protein LZK77_16175 [Rhizobium leguminosarum]